MSESTPGRIPKNHHGFVRLLDSITYTEIERKRASDRGVVVRYLGERALDVGPPDDETGMSIVLDTKMAPARLNGQLDFSNLQHLEIWTEFLKDAGRLPDDSYLVRYYELIHGLEYPIAESPPQPATNFRTLDDLEQDGIVPPFDGPNSFGIS